MIFIGQFFCFKNTWYLKKSARKSIWMWVARKLIFFLVWLGLGLVNNANFCAFFAISIAISSDESTSSQSETQYAKPQKPSTSSQSGSRQFYRFFAEGKVPKFSAQCRWCFDFVKTQTAFAHSRANRCTKTKKARRKMQATIHCCLEPPSCYIMGIWYEHAAVPVWATQQQENYRILAGDDPTIRW